MTSEREMSKTLSEYHERRSRCHVWWKTVPEEEEEKDDDDDDDIV